ncbi:hypothetical protein NS228_17475 [Methylobacterium indicum]|uniref:hypothetical protein n=1 Tax=Methylobacterium indicum TaxID=1775910 RepID=UPI000734405B|nr:hypothetical protein [Methylobacterium indicum]KTS37783.1 hypothetical protein NS229_06105 [Methylobacterium indicum]KTS38332.1 hypothetical protein NS228_17475 [Methylobacterium indicum]KTS53670.1 hypothetical protein NS230_04710 [Methylobacterium indicum]
MRSTLRLAALVAITLAPAPLLAQAGPQTGNPGAGDPSVTGSLGTAARTTTGVGQTKPPGAALGPDAGLTPDLQARDREIGRKIETEICTGCTE